MRRCAGTNQLSCNVISCPCIWQHFNNVNNQKCELNQPLFQIIFYFSFTHSFPVFTRTSFTLFISCYMLFISFIVKNNTCLLRLFYITVALPLRWRGQNHLRLLIIPSCSPPLFQWLF